MLVVVYFSSKNGFNRHTQRRIKAINLCDYRRVHIYAQIGWDNAVHPKWPNCSVLNRVGSRLHSSSSLVGRWDQYNICNVYACELGIVHSFHPFYICDFRECVSILINVCFIILPLFTTHSHFIYSVTNNSCFFLYILYKMIFRTIMFFLLWKKKDLCFFHETHKA